MIIISANTRKRCNIEESAQNPAQIFGLFIQHIIFPYYLQFIFIFFLFLSLSLSSFLTIYSLFLLLCIKFSVSFSVFLLSFSCMFHILHCFINFPFQCVFFLSCLLSLQLIEYYKVQKLLRDEHKSNLQRGIPPQGFVFIGGVLYLSHDSGFFMKI